MESNMTTRDFFKLFKKNSKWICTHSGPGFKTYTEHLEVYQVKRVRREWDDAKKEIVFECKNSSGKIMGYSSLFDTFINASTITQEDDKVISLSNEGLDFTTHERKMRFELSE